MKRIACLLALACASTLAQAESPETYHYGMHLDIAKVISQTLPQGCQVGEARMVYLDSKGERHTLIYQRIGEDCRY
ncbi:DUF2790 domain-containing protein [Ectopseudomonas mendocina]|jgi:hypothetical protein|uniref:DUF2790 domain-containing protein n=1 Tax=Ectopseudomonas mendocina TaxID=300 RepID=A0A2R3QRU8_ECTME|nr:DUF2790 domain-containing protein [Pseudomonas mendocina]AVO54430.1 DUF2790 domain-containing protein [Pseudomonas mendocina]